MKLRSIRSVQESRVDVSLSERGLILFCWGMILAVVGVVGATLWQTYNRTEDRAREQALVLVGLVTDDAADLLRLSDFVLLHVRDSIAAAGLRGATLDSASHRAIVDLLRKEQALMPESATLSLADADGVVLADSRGEISNDSIAGRPDFQRLKAMAADDAAAPATGWHPVRGSSKPAFFVSRRLNGPDGGFLGVVSLTLKDSFAPRWQARLSKEGTSVALFSRDDPQVAAHLDKVGIGKAAAPLLAAFAASDDMETARTVAGAVDGTAGVVAMRKMTGYPFIGLLSLPRRVYAAEWQKLALQAVLALAALMAMGAILTTRAIRQAGITKRLRHSEESLRSAQEVAAIGSWEFDAPSGHVTWSEEMYHIWGVEPGTPVDYQRVLDVVHPLDRQLLDHAWRAALEPEGDVYDVTHRIIVDGTVKWIRALAQMTFDEAGQMVHMIGTSQDVTDRKRAEDALRRSEEDYRGIVEGALEGIARTSLDGRVLSANSASARMLGYDSVDEMMATLTDAQQQLYVRPHERATTLATLLEQDSIAGRELEIRRKDGQTLWALVNMRLVRDEAGQPLYIETFSTDITQRKQAEAELIRHRDHLEELVRERTAELTTAKERAEVANLAKSAFLANMSHELRTPLNGILGFAQVLLREVPADSPQAGGLNIIRSSGEHLLRLINDVLDLARVEAGRLELNVAVVELKSCLDMVVDSVRVRAEAKGLRFLVDMGSGLPRLVEVDDMRLRQILLNLLGNAVKFTTQGEVVLRVRRLPDGNGRAHLRFEVTDTGTGIDVEHFESIFLPFEQAGDAQERSAGTGLGLAISRQLVRLMGDDLRLESTPGAGSRFWFDLFVPVVGGDVQAAPIHHIAVGYEGERRKVLVVDDVAENRAFVVDLLRTLGFDTYQSDNGQAGVDAAMAVKPDLVLMDNVMPVMTGQEATRRLRQTPGLADVPIIAMSASVTPADQRSSLTTGANAFVAKPIDIDLLLHHVGELLRIVWIREPRFDRAR